MDTDKKVKILKEKLLSDLSNRKLTTLYNIIEKKEPCSIRLIECFVSSYSNEYKISYNLNGCPFNVYSSYKDEQMSSYNKKLFDMYRRMQRFKVKLNNGNFLETTVAQLNFFSWVFKSKILDYITPNLEKIKIFLDGSKPKTINQKKFFNNVVVSRKKITIYFD